MHNRLIAESSRHGLTSRITVLASPSDWEDMLSGPVVFDLVSNVGRIHGQRRVIPLAPLPGESNKEIDWWMSWHEEWSIVARRLWFRSAGWGLYCAPSATDQLKLAVRAEWGPLNEDGKCDSSAGQPHWHAHSSHPWVRFMSAESGAMADAEATLNVEGMHLGMAGWRQPHPKRWQERVSEEHHCLVDRWAIATLEYLREQIRHVKVVTTSRPPLTW